MPLIQVTMAAGRTPEQKRALLQALSDATVEALDAPVESIRVWITELPPEHFIAGGEILADRRPVAAEPPGR